MDLLDALEDRGKSTTFNVQYDTQLINNDTDIRDEEEERGGEGDAETQQISTQLIDNSIADKVKQRLAQANAEPNWDEFSFGTSSLFPQTQVIEKDAEVLNHLITQKDHYLPQLDIEDVEIETQMNEPETTEGGTQPMAEAAGFEATGTKEERLLKITKLAEAKRQARLAKEKQEEELLADITHTSLTDEEEDLADSTVISSAGKEPSDKNLREVEEFLQIQKRAKDLQPEFKRKVVFTTENLLNEFDDDSDKESIGLEQTANSPITSPLKTKINKGDPNSDREDNIPSDPISEYAKNLRNQLLSSPSKNEIDLDSDLGDEDNAIPALSKDEALRIKQKFLLKKMKGNPKSKLIHLPKNIRNSINNQPRHFDSKQLINNLQQANINQLQRERKSNPLNEEMIEIEKDEEVMGSLLERELERVRNIRKREKILAKAKEALLNGNHEDVEEDNEGEEEVPDSDFGEEFEDDDEEDEEEEEKEEEDEDVDSEIETLAKKPRIIISDDEDRNDDRNDDSYMFGAKEVDKEEEGIPLNDGYVTTGNSPSNEISSEKEPSVPVEVNENEKYELFQNLKSRDSSFQQTQANISQEIDDISHLKVPSFKDISQATQTTQATQADTTIATQADGTQKLATQKIQPSSFVEDTQVLDNDTQILNVDDDDDDDDINPTNVRRARKLIRQNMSDVEEGVEEEDDDEESGPTEEEKKRQIQEYEQKIRRTELKSRKKRKEMERKGLKKIVEGEAEESEDEWHGLGGIDAELSDEQANSDDEKMIDNDFNIDLNDDEVKRKFMEQYQIKDKKELEKLLDDIKNHKLTKRAGANNGFDIELSDEEDELLSAYRKQRLAEQRSRLLENKKLQELAKNAKSKAFFTSIQDSTLLVRLDEDGDTSVNESDKENIVEEEKEIEAELDSKKRVIRVEESFVQKQLSFLRNVGENDEEFEYLRQQRISNIQHGYGSDVEEFDDLQKMKKKCMENLVQGSRANSVNVGDKRALDNTDIDTDDEESEFFPSFKRPSLTRSFKSSEGSLEVSSFSGVTIRKQYKTANGAKASISGMSAKRISLTGDTTSLKEKRIAKSISRAKRSSSLFQAEGFDN